MKKGVILSLFAALISGISVFSNGLFINRTDPVLFVFLRNMITGIILTGIIISSGRLSVLKRLTRSDWLKLIGIGLIGGGIPFALFFTGLAQIGAVNSNIINKSLFLWVAVLAVPVLGERLRWAAVIGYGLVLYALLGTGISQITLSNGTVLVLSATILWAVEHVIAKKALGSIPPVVVSWARMLFGLPVLISAVIMKGSVPVILTDQALIALLVSSVLLSGYMLTWYGAVKHAPVTLVSSILVLAPVITLLFNTVVFHFSTSAGQWYGAGLLISGVFVITLVSLMSRRKNGAGYGI
jgi:drug/metabolite transporter (DMT)-like permease